MDTYRVHLAPPRRTTFGGGMFVMGGWQSGPITAADEAAAIEQARAKCRETFDDGHADGKATVRRLHRYAVTLRGKRDKRRRETFYTVAQDEVEARGNIQYNAAATRFAGTIYRADNPKTPIVKIEKLA